MLGAVESVATAQLAGNYTINPAAAASSSNFPYLSAAVSALTAQGVGGAVEFEVYDDSGPYTATMPFVTSAVQWQPSTAVLVLEQWLGASAANRVTFKAAAGESPVFDAALGAMGVFWNGADYCTLDGVEIKNAPMDGVSLYSEPQHGQVLGAVIRRCRIHDCGAAGIAIYGNSERPQNTIVENNFLWNLQSTNAGGFGALARFGYVSGRRHDNSRLLNNTFYVTTASGNSFAVVGDSPSGGTGSHFAELSNNIIVKTSNSIRPVLRFPLIGSTGIPPVVDANCYLDTSGGPFSEGEVVAADFTTWQTLSGKDMASLEADPLLVSPAVGDLHLTSTSPCVGASSVSSGVTDDIDGEPRDAFPDIGADELGNPSQLTLSMSPLPNGEVEATLVGLPAGVTAGITLTSTATSGQVGAGPLWGIHPSYATFLLLGSHSTPAVGDPLHFVGGVSGAFPLTAYLVPLSVVTALAGETWDLVCVVYGPNVVQASNVERITW